MTIYFFWMQWHTSEVIGHASIAKRHTIEKITQQIFYNGLAGLAQTCRKGGNGDINLYLHTIAFIHVACYHFQHPLICLLSLLSSWNRKVPLGVCCSVDVTLRSEEECCFGCFVSTQI